MAELKNLGASAFLDPVKIDKSKIIYCESGDDICIIRKIRRGDAVAIDVTLIGSNEVYRGCFKDETLAEINFGTCSHREFDISTCAMKYRITKNKETLLLFIRGPNDEIDMNILLDRRTPGVKIASLENTVLAQAREIESLKSKLAAAEAPTEPKSKHRRTGP